MAGEVITVTIDEGTAEIRFLVSAETACFNSPEATITRASHVEPVSRPLRYAFHTLRYIFGENGRIGAFTRQWPVLWRVNLSPVHGPILPFVWYDRNEAIKAEIIWLETNFL